MTGVPTLEISLLIVLAAQVPLLGLAAITAFSQRKKQPPRRGERGAMRPPADGLAVDQARSQPQASKPEILPRSEILPETPPTITGPTVQEPSEPIAEPPPTPPQVIEPVAEESKPSASELPDMPAPEAELPPPPSEPPATPEAEVQPPPIIAVPEAAPEPAPAIGIPPAEPLREPIRLGLGLRKTRENFIARIRAAITGSGRTDEIYEGLEEALISADAGVETSLKIIEAVRAKLKNDARPDVIQKALQEEIEGILAATERPLADSGDAPLVVMMAGVNGAGKTTTVAKLADRLKRERGTVLVAAADTFRAAAIEQLQVWCDRVGVDLIKQKQGSDPAAVAFDAVKAAIARKASAVLIDTAGRLQTKVNLMEELKKVARVVGRELPGAPHEIWLVLDANTGQNALSQAKQFGDAVPLTGVILAKLDSTAKGGVIIGIAERLKLPVRFVGLGENLEDLRPFDAREFAAALFGDSENGAAKSVAA
jgi:fused signal recognition particle receptor